MEREDLGTNKFRYTADFVIARSELENFTVTLEFGDQQMIQSEVKLIKVNHMPRQVRLFSELIFLGKRVMQDVQNILHAKEVK